MDPLVAELTVIEVEAQLAVGRARIASLRTILVAFAVVLLGGAVAVLLIGRDRLLAYFLPAQVIAFVVAYRAHRRVARDHGVQASFRPWIITAVAVTACAATISRLSFEADAARLTECGPMLAYAAGYFALARWARSRPLTAAVLLMPLVTGVVMLILRDDAAVAAQLGAFAAIMLAAACLTPRSSAT